MMTPTQNPTPGPKRRSSRRPTRVCGPIAISIAWAILGIALDSAQAALVAHYPLDGNANDIVGGRHGTLIDDATFSANVPAALGTGQSLALDGVDDKVHYDIPAGDVVSGTFTVALWINPSQKATQDRAHAFFGTRYPSDHSFDVMLRVDNRVRTDIGTGVSWLTIFDTPPNVVDFTVNTWFHVVVAVTPTSHSIYVNGNLLASGALPGSTPLLWDQNHDIGIGGSGGSAFGDGSAFEGMIDDVRIYDTALTQDEIQALANPTACTCEAFTATDFAPPMGKRKPTGSTLPIKFHLFFNGVAVQGEDELAAALAAAGCPDACPIIQVFDVTDLTEGVELLEDEVPTNVGDPDAGNCFRYSDGNWIYNLQLGPAFQPQGSFMVRVLLGECVLFPGNALFQTK